MQFERRITISDASEVIIDFGEIEYDSMGLFTLGVTQGVRRLHPVAQLAVAAAHPRNLKGNKQFACGFPAEKYRPDRPITVFEPGKMNYALKLATSSAQHLDTDCRNYMELSSKDDHLAVMAIHDGLKEDDLWHMPTLRDDHVDPALAGAEDEGAVHKDWPPHTWECKEVMASSIDFDPNGDLWGLGAHWPLLVNLQIAGAGTGRRERSGKGDQDRKTRNMKVKECNRTGIWPWWIKHPSEKCFWAAKRDVMEGNQARGQEYQGVLWRLTRAKYEDDPDTLDAYEADWVQTYGEVSMEIALAFTQPFYEEAVRQGFTVEELWYDDSRWE